MTKLIAPNGMEIRGTLERLTGVALASVTRDKNGAVCIEHLGETEIEWDEQKTEFRDGKEVLVDEEGNEWTSDQLVEAEERVCRECGKDMFVGVDGTSHHWGKSFDDIDHSADRDHVAVED